MAKLNVNGSTLVYSTYLGGDGSDAGRSIRADAEGNAYVVGATGSSNFPTTAGAFDTTLNGQDAFVSKVNPTGSALVYSTYLGGSLLDDGLNLAVDASGHAYVSGYTDSTDFPTLNAFQAASGGGRDAFVTMLNPTGSAVVYSTYLGGSSTEQPYGIAIDNAEAAYVVGDTYSGNFPTVNALQPLFAGGVNDVFIAKISLPFTLTVAKSGTGSGTVTSAPAGINCGATCTAGFATGTAVTLTASPAAGSAFSGWSGACSGTGTCQVTMDANKSVTAAFAQTFTLTVTKAGSGTGTVTSNPAGIDCGATCSAGFSGGTGVTLSASPASGSVFTGWSGACSGAGACNVTLNADASVTATFTRMFALTVNKTGTGSGTVTSNPAGINCGSSCNASFASGTAVTLTASPDSGSGFTGWSACSGMATCAVTMDSDRTVSAAFALPTFADVPISDWGFGWIHQIYQRGITAGCGTNPLRFCPDNQVTRREMAVFIVRSMGQTQVSPCTGVFADVPTTDWGCGWIERIAQLGITAGCATNPARYCPDNNVSRREMAVFLNRATGQSQCATCGPTFADVPQSDWGYGWIERLFQRGITAGCAANPLRYCPDNNVTRREMAVFLIRNFFP